MPINPEVLHFKPTDEASRSFFMFKTPREHVARTAMI